VPAVSLDEWIQALTDSAGEIASTSLGYGQCQVKEKESVDSLLSLTAPNLVGAYISVLSHEHSLNLGLLADASGCENLAKALLGMDAQETLPEEDVTDSLREIVNILAGGVKRRMSERENTLQLGLPLVVRGQVAVTELMEAARVKMMLGPIDVQLHIIRNRLGN
jgi:CheY-specific phosphatase CheX